MRGHRRGRVYARRAVGGAGTSLLLPPWFEEQRAAIVQMLEPITVPEENLPAGAQVGKRQAAPGLSEAAAEAARLAAERDAEYKGVSRRTDATFVESDKK